jgi:hypothetical protein
MEGEYKVPAAKPMTLQDRVLQIDHIQARRFYKSPLKALLDIFALVPEWMLILMLRQFARSSMTH